jgi:hypothetical protein
VVTVSDLSAWTQNNRADPADLTDEHAVWLKLSRWFDDHGANVYWEESRPGLPDHWDEFGFFNANTTERPDLIVDGDELTFAVEVKTGDTNSDILSGASQTVRYWRDYCRQDIERTYKVDRKELNVDAFLLATRYSPEGAVFRREYDPQTRDRPATDRVGWYDHGHVYWLPEWEFKASEVTTRSIWRQAKQRIEKNPDASENDFIDDEPGVGVILSDALDWKRVDRPESDDVTPFDFATEATVSPKALYKRPVGNCPKTTSGVDVHNWRWAE